MGRIIKASVMKTSSMPVSFRVFEQPRGTRAEQGESPEEVAASFIERSKLEAAIIVRTAEAEAENIVESARQEGYQQGYKAGASEAMLSMQPLMNRLESDVASFESETATFFETLEPEMLKLCFTTVEKVIRHEIKINPNVVTRIIKHCLRRVKESHEVRVRVNPSEVEAVRAQREKLLSLAEGVQTINIVDDRRISAGGCVIETANGDFDATIETQLGKVEHTLMETFENDCYKTNAEPGEIPEGYQ